MEEKRRRGGGGGPGGKGGEMVQKDNAAHAVQQNHMKNNQYVEKKNINLDTVYAV